MSIDDFSFSMPNKTLFNFGFFNIFFKFTNWFSMHGIIFMSIWFRCDAMRVYGIWLFDRANCGCVYDTAHVLFINLTKRSKLNNTRRWRCRVFSLIFSFLVSFQRKTKCLPRCQRSVYTASTIKFIMFVPLCILARQRCRLAGFRKILFFFLAARSTHGSSCFSRFAACVYGCFVLFYYYCYFPLRTRLREALYQIRWTEHWTALNWTELNWAKLNRTS